MSVARGVARILNRNNKSLLNTRQLHPIEFRNYSLAISCRNQNRGTPKVAADKRRNQCKYHTGVTVSSIPPDIRSTFT